MNTVMKPVLNPDEFLVLLPDFAQFQLRMEAALLGAEVPSWLAEKFPVETVAETAVPPREHRLRLFIPEGWLPADKIPPESEPFTMEFSFLPGEYLFQVLPFQSASLQCRGDAVILSGETKISVALQAALLAALFPSLKISLAAQPDPVSAEEEFQQLHFRFRRAGMNALILGRDPAAGLRFLDKTGILEKIFPELTGGRNLTQNRFHAYDIFEHSLQALNGAFEADPVIRWSALMHDLGKVPTRKVTENGEATFHNHEMASARMVAPIMQRFGIPKSTGDKVRFLVRNHMFHYTDEWSDKAIRRFMKKISREDLKSLIAVRMADRRGSGKKTAFPASLQKLIDHIEEVERAEAAFKIRDLAVNGHDLQEMGLKPSPLLGRIIRLLFDEVSGGGLENEKSALLKRAEELIRVHEKKQ